MDFDLMITSFPKLLSATVITLKLLSVSLIISLPYAGRDCLIAIGIWIL